MLEQYLPIVLIFALAGVVETVIVILSTYIGPTKKTPTKYQPFEAGSAPVGTTRSRFSVKFYVVAIIFILFDIETVFLYPWAVLFGDFQASGMAALMLAEMFAFIAVLAIGLVYVWKKGALEWD